MLQPLSRPHLPRILLPWTPFARALMDRGQVEFVQDPADHLHEIASVDFLVLIPDEVSLIIIDPVHEDLEPGYDLGEFSLGYALRIPNKHRHGLVSLQPRIPVPGPAFERLRCFIRPDPDPWIFPLLPIQRTVFCSDPLYPQLERPLFPLRLDVDPLLEFLCILKAV